jgi:hypothetical protein
VLRQCKVKNSQVNRSESIDWPIQAIDQTHIETNSNMRHSRPKPIEALASKGDQVLATEPNRTRPSVVSVICWE